MLSKQYLKMVASAIGVIACSLCLDSEFLASVLSESDGALSVPSKLFDFISMLFFVKLSSYVISVWVSIKGERILNFDIWTLRWKQVIVKCCFFTCFETPVASVTDEDISGPTLKRFNDGLHFKSLRLDTRKGPLPLASWLTWGLSLPPGKWVSSRGDVENGLLPTIDGRTVLFLDMQRIGREYASRNGYFWVPVVWKHTQKSLLSDLEESWNKQKYTCHLRNSNISLLLFFPLSQSLVFADKGDSKKQLALPKSRNKKN